MGSFEALAKGSGYLVSVYKLTVSKKVVISRQGGESRVPGEKRDPVLEMVPDFRRVDVWAPAPAPDLIRGSPG